MFTKYFYYQTEPLFAQVNVQARNELRTLLVQNSVVKVRKPGATIASRLAQIIQKRITNSSNDLTNKQIADQFKRESFSQDFI